MIESDLQSQYKRNVHSKKYQERGGKLTSQKKAIIRRKATYISNKLIDQVIQNSSPLMKDYGEIRKYRRKRLFISLLINSIDSTKFVSEKDIDSFFAKVNVKGVLKLFSQLVTEGIEKKIYYRLRVRLTGIEFKKIYEEIYLKIGAELTIKYGYEPNDDCDENEDYESPNKKY